MPDSRYALLRKLTDEDRRRIFEFAMQVSDEIISRIKKEVPMCNCGKKCGGGKKK